MRPRRWLKCEAGSAIVEFALVVPILMMIVFGIIDLGRASYSKSLLTAAVQDGLRVASVLDDPASRADTVLFVVRRGLAARGGGDITDGQLSVSVDEVTQQVTVGVTNYPVRFITPLAHIAGGDRFTVNYQARSAWERAP